MNPEVLKENLLKNGFLCSVFETGKDAAAYLNEKIDQKTVGFGGSMTLREMGLYELLSSHNEVFWHWELGERTNAEVLKAAQTSEIYLSSVNGIAETGEIINIDGTGNRVSAIQYGHEKVYLVVGINKIAEDYEKALYRARNVASPLNAKRLNKKTPCAINGDRCYDCNNPERICRGLSVLWKKPGGSQYEVVIVKENLGY